MDETAATTAKVTLTSHPSEPSVLQTNARAMRSSTYWKAVLVDRDNFLERVLEFLRTSGVDTALSMERA
jgi:hypothetical protein